MDNSPASEPVTETQPLQPSSLIRSVCQWGIVLWVCALVFYFHHKEGLINWQWIEKPVPAIDQDAPASKVPKPWYSKLDPRLEVSEHRGAYTAVLRNLPGTYRVWVENAPFREIGLAACMLLLYLVLGRGVLECFDVYFPRAGHNAIALVLGSGTAAFVFELITMAGLLNRRVVIAAWIIMFVAVFILAHFRREVFARARTDMKAHQSRIVQQQIARAWLYNSVPKAGGFWTQTYFAVAMLLILVISALTLIHGVAFPETYWDSLILYMGYARKMFLEQAFPLKVVGQVGIGLGANYPHLYPILTAQTAAAAGYWNDAFAQLFPPCAGIASVILVYYMTLEFTRNRVIAISTALLYRAVPYGIIYHQYASDYAIAILFTAAFLYCIQRYVLDGLPGYLHLSLLTAAFSVHINYLMWVLWITAGIAVIVAHAGNRQVKEERVIEPEDILDPAPLIEIEQPSFMTPRVRPGFLELLLKPGFWWPVLGALAISSTWYIRNIIMTGNPVYAFFYNIFPSKYVNPDVMKSAEQEWLLNGDGMGRVGATLAEKLSNSWLYFVTGSQHWKIAPVFVAFVLPGFAIFAFRLLNSIIRLGRKPAFDDSMRSAVVFAFLFLFLWYYEYCIASFYLYQIIVVLPLFGLFISMVFEFCSRRNMRTILCVAVLAVGCAPGVITGLMGFKLKNTGVYAGMPSPQFHLTALKNLFMDPKMFYRMEFGGDMEGLGRVNWLPRGSKVLTHENRHLLLNEGIRIIHLDDWEVQKAYDKLPKERIALLDELGIDYYYYMPNEDKHVANSWLGMDELIGLNYFEEVYRTSSAGHSTPELVQHKHIPRDMNVLYRRVSSSSDSLNLTDELTTATQVDR